MEVISSLIGLISGVLGLCFLAYMICYVFRYNWIVKRFNKWAKVDFVPEKRWNKLLLHGFGAVLTSMIISVLITLGAAALFVSNTPGEETASQNTMTIIWGITYLLSFAGTFLYGYFYVRHRVNKCAIMKRQAVWEMIYGVCSVYAIASAIVLAIYAVMIALMIAVGLLIIWLGLSLLAGRSVDVRTTGLFSTTKKLHENPDGTWSDSMGKTYVRDGKKFYETED